MSEREELEIEYFNQTLKSPEVRKKVFKSFCEWMSEGKMKKSFYYDDGVTKISWQAMKRYIKLYPHDMPAVDLEIAIAQGVGYWEEEVGKAALGQNRKANFSCLQMILRNKCGWDRSDRNPDDDISDEEREDKFSDVKDFFRALRGEDLSPSTPDTTKPDDRKSKRSPETTFHCVE